MDSGSNIKLACRLLGWKRLPCFAHNLDLAITKGLRDSSIEEVLQVCRKVVSQFSQSWKRTRDLAISQRDNELPLHKLKVDCATRWGSSYDMISRIAEQQKAICIMLARDQRCISLLSLLDFESIDSMISVLKPLRELTDILAAEKRVSVSAVKPLVQHICNKMLESNNEDTDLAKDMKARIKCDLLHRYDDPEVDQLLSLCSSFQKRLSEEDRLAAISMVKKELLEMEEAKNHKEPAVATLEPPCKKSAFSRILGDDLDERPTQSSVLERVNQKVDSYLQMPVVDIDQSPLEWWRRHKSEFALVSRLARKYLCTCATSVAFERVFSAAGYIGSNLRSCLKPSKIDQLTFLARNLD